MSDTIYTCPCDGTQKPNSIHYGVCRIFGDTRKNSDDRRDIEDKKHSHYFKDVSKLQSIDVYRVLDLFFVTDPCLQHSIKKLLVSGSRGVKSVEKDVQEAIDSLIRWQEMQKEN